MKLDDAELYHIVHIDRLQSILDDGHLYCDSTMRGRSASGTTIGLSTIKERRLTNRLQSHPGLTVGQCVPFYFCPRSVMLYLLSKGNAPGLTYTGGQKPILHLRLSMNAVVSWAKSSGKRFAFTLGNAGAVFFEDRSDLRRLNEINWTAVKASDWREPDVKEGKQAEFLVEECVPWNLVEQIGAVDKVVAAEVLHQIQGREHQPIVSIRPDWYY
jgi:hypothetical protein